MNGLESLARLFKGRSARSSRLIALDGDGVLIDYHEGYAMAWERAFGERPKVKDPEGYHPKDYWDVPELDFESRLHLKEKGFTREVWQSMPAISGAKQACEMLWGEGYELVCVTALSERFAKDRKHNLIELGFKIRSVYTAGTVGLGNPKAAIIKKLGPAAFVDDYLPYLQSIPQNTWCALIQGRPHNSPNALPNFKPPDSSHASVLDFARFWVKEKHR